MQELVFLIIKVFFVILAISVVGIVATVIIRKPKPEDDVSANESTATRTEPNTKTDI